MKIWDNIKSVFTTDERTEYRQLDGYLDAEDGYAENPFAHGPNSGRVDRENEYFMQWVLPSKLHRVALRTAVGWRLTYGFAEDVWNNEFGIKIPGENDKSDKINRKLIPYLQDRRFFQEMEKFTAYNNEQGESILLCYYKDSGNVDNYMNPVTDSDEILRVEAFNPIDYWIPKFDKHGDPARYRIKVKGPGKNRSLITVDVHPSRVIRKTGDNVEYRYTGYSELAVVYDAVVVLSTILKASGEAAFRWGTGHPTFFTKDLIKQSDFEKLADKLEDYTRRSLHFVPSEYVDRIEMLGQAGSMLNLKALADIALNQVIIGSGFPRPILLGEVAGVVSGNEVSERSYYALLDSEHTALEPVIRKYFEMDKNIRSLLKGVDYWEIKWGIRQVLSKTGEVEYRQKKISNSLALTQICTIDECRQLLGFEPIGEEQLGTVILGLEQFYMAELQAEMMEMRQTGDQQINTSYDQASRETQKQQKSDEGDLEKNKRVQPTQFPDSKSIKEVKKERMEKLKDAFEDILEDESVNSLSDDLHLYPKTLRKILKNIGDKNT